MVDQTPSADATSQNRASARADQLAGSTDGLIRKLRRGLSRATARTPLLNLRPTIVPGDRLLLVPQALRTVDPSFLTELNEGCLGLAGSVTSFAGGSPFLLTPPTDGWRDALHGFEWLPHLAATRTSEARALGEAWITDWAKRYRRRTGDPWQHAVTARRLIHLLCGAGFILKDCDARFHDAYVALSNRHLQHLMTVAPTMADGLPHLEVLTSALYGALCIADQERIVDDLRPHLGDALRRQILPDGSAISRETSSIVEIVLDLLPLDRCFTSRGMQQPPELTLALQRALRYIDHMRLGDGMLARFNGVGPTWPDRVAAALAYRDVQTPPIEEARYSGYARMQRGDAILIMDVGVPPPYDASAHAHAGCLSFEFSAGTAPIVVNCGAPGPADPDWGPLGRGTAAHSTLTLNDASSSILVRNPLDEERLDGIPIEGPERVERVVRDEADGGMSTSAWHDGYVSRFGMRHERILALNADGTILRGTDRLAGGGRVFPGRGRTLQHFAIRFHLHPRARVRRGARTGVVEIQLGDGALWEFSSSDGPVNLEESIFLAELSGPLQSIQLVVRGTVSDQTEVRWALRRADVPLEPIPEKADAEPPAKEVDAIPVRDTLRVVATPDQDAAHDAAVEPDAEAAPDDTADGEEQQATSTRVSTDDGEVAGDEDTAMRDD
ncbi:MAG: heparinase II/III family protein [Pseudomonadota bacterium]